MNPNGAFEKVFFHRIAKEIHRRGAGNMDAFLALAGQLFLILCIQSVLEALASRWQNNFMQKPIDFGCYLACMLAVLRFMESYVFGIFRTISHFFKNF